LAGAAFFKTAVFALTLMALEWPLVSALLAGFDDDLDFAADRLLVGLGMGGFLP